MSAIRLPPYAKLLGLRLEGGILVMPYAASLIGSPNRLHGGVVAGLLEIAANIKANAVLADAAAPLKPIGVTVDFYRGVALEDTFAEALVLRLGRRVVNVRADAWQQDRARPIASATINMLIVRAAKSQDK